MSKLDDLINRLCPDGVEYKKIKDCYQRLRGTPITAEKMKEISSKDGEVKIFAGGKTVINAKESDIPNANITRVPAVLVQSRGVIDAIFYEKPFTFKNEMWAYTTDERISVKFLYYVLKNNIQIFRDAASGMGSLPQISLKVTEEFEIPVPPLEVQNEIVRILDKFTSLEAELEAELEARRKQYEYYRDSLLSFGDDVEWKTLGEIAKLQAGKAISASELSSDKTESLYPCYGGNGLRGYIKKYSDDGNYSIIGRQGALCGNVKYVEGKFYATEHAVVVYNKESINSKFLYYTLVKMNLNQYKSAGAQPGLSVAKLVPLKIQIPSLSEQQRIVAILDRFESLCNDITSGLPAEIEARHKQYEYYRDKLLTFKRKEAV